MRLILLSLISLLVACTPASDNRLVQPKDPYAMGSMTGEAMNVIVEIPAGTNHKIEYHAGEGFVNDTLETGDTRVIDFLPYPGNYGFVPSTMMDRERGGDGDPLDVLVLSESVPTGTLLTVRPIATLLLRDRGEIDTKIIAVPTDEALRVFQATDFLSFSLNHDAARAIIESWFLNYKGPRKTELIRWEDETYAWQELAKWRRDAAVDE